MEHPLATNHRDGRLRLLQLAAGLTDDQAATFTTACPDWTIKDVYAHLAGISTDILAGNTEKAATVEWADGHVADRAGQSFGDVVAEWTDAGAQVDELTMAFGDAFPFQLFIDQWTHEWDVRATLGAAAAATPDLEVYEFVIKDLAASAVGRAPAGIGQLTVSLGETSFSLGEGGDVGTLSLSPFEAMRVAMGRRSMPQLLALPWPAGVDDPEPWIEALVAWSVNDRDVDDPVLAS